jgi:hypothetical protein
MTIIPDRDHLLILSAEALASLIEDVGIAA